MPRRRGGQGGVVLFSVVVVSVIVSVAAYILLISNCHHNIIKTQTHKMKDMKSCRPLPSFSRRDQPAPRAARRSIVLCSICMVCTMAQRWLC